jgi:hypothetical protein
MKIQHLGLLVSLLTIAILPGCSSHMMAIKYEPSWRTTESKIPEKIHMGSVKDLRGTESNWLGAIRGGYGNPLKKLYTDQDTAQVVAAAFEDALEVRGLLGVVADSEFRIEVELHKFDTSYYFNKEAHVNFEMMLSQVSTGKVMFSQFYRTNRKKAGAGAGIFGNVEALASFANETLNQAIDKALDDEDFRSALQASPATPMKGDSIESRLVELELLREKSLITEEEYQRKRKALIDEL